MEVNNYEALKEFINSYIQKVGTSTDKDTLTALYKAITNNLPTFETEPIICCRDCFAYNAETRYCSYWMALMGEKDYCSQGRD